MKKEIIVVDADSNQSESICKLLMDHNYEATTLAALYDVVNYVDSSLVQIIIINLDNLPVDKIFFKKLKALKPNIEILGLSNRSFHPELEEIISQYIFACIKKPIDIEELIFLLNSLKQNELNFGSKDGFHTS